MSDLRGIWTQYGLEQITAWITFGQQLNITHAAIGSGLGAIPPPSPAQTGLKEEVWRGPVSSVQLNPDDATDVMVDVVLPNDIGGFWIREWGLYDSQGKLIAVGPHDEMHKPLITSGQAAEFMERFHLPVSNNGAINITIASQALATQSYVAAQVTSKVAAHDTETGAHAALMNSHTSATSVHSATSAPTASRIIIRDNSGRAQVAAPSVAADIARKAEVDSVAAALAAYTPYQIGEFKAWYRQEPPPGWLVCNGSVLAAADVNYPLLWAYLQLSENAWLLKTLAQWQALSTPAPWVGVGGVPYYVLDTTAKTIKLPDTRGMIMTNASPSLAVGAAQGDAIRNIQGGIANVNVYNYQDAYGAFLLVGGKGTNNGAAATGLNYWAGWELNASQQVPTASENRPKRFGALGCVYVGGE